MDLRMNNVFALSLKRQETHADLHEFELPDLSATILIPDASWIPQYYTSTATDWGLLTQDNLSAVAVAQRSGKKTSVLHHAINFELDRSARKSDLPLNIVVGFHCTETRSGMHHEILDKEDGSFTINGQLVRQGSQVYEAVHHVQELISLC
jgi:hypothetical protein